MTENLDANTFDLIGFLSGRDLPTLTVRVPFDERIGIKINDISERLAEAEAGLDQDAEHALREEMREALQEKEDRSWEILLRAIPEGVRKDILNKVLTEYPITRDAFNREVADPKANEALERGLWEAYIETITTSEGATTLVGPGEVDSLLNKAPLHVQDAIAEGIQTLQTSARKGFQVAQEANFLSAASPEG